MKKKYKNVSSYKVNLTPVFEALRNEISSDGPQNKIEMSLANTRARLRMTTLYYHAGLNNYIVAGIRDNYASLADHYFMKFDSDDNKIWNYTYDLFGNDNSYGIAIDSNNNFVAVPGWFNLSNW